MFTSAADVFGPLRHRVGVAANPGSRIRGGLKDELLSREVFVRGVELQAALTEFQDHCNNHRPHLRLGELTPANFKETGNLSGTHRNEP